MSSRRQMLEFLSLSRLPSAFQEVEYLESSGTQYIDSGATANQIGKIISIFQFVENLNDTYLYGCGDTNYNRIYFGVYTSKWLIGFGGYSVFGTFDTNKHTLSHDILNNEYIFDGNNYSYVGNQIEPVNFDLILFARINHSGNTISNYSKSKIYSLTIYDTNDTLIRDFVPCYRKADNVAGLYDLVNGVFYTNAGTGTFTKGPNVGSFTLISFLIGSNTYQAESGMTWAQWCVSNYNTDGYQVYDSYIYDSELGNRVSKLDTNSNLYLPVNPTTTIDANESYELQPAGGGSN